MGQVKIKIRAFPYFETVKDPVTEEDQRVERIARRGDVIDLPDAELERAKRFDAIVDADADLPEPGEQPAPPESVEQLAEWIKNDKPTVDQVVERANNDPDTAQRLIEAEELATGQQPRSSLIEKLEAIVEQGS